MELYLIISFPLLILLSAIFSGSETAFFSLSKLDLAQLEEDHPNRGKAVRRMLEKPDFLLNGILLGNMLVNICATAVATILLHHFGKAQGWSDQVIYLVDIISMTAVLLILGEISPKVYAISQARRLAPSLANFVSAWMWLTNPVIRFTTAFSLWLKRLITKREEDREILEEELKMMVDITAEKGDLEQEEKQMIHNIFDMSETMVREIMVPRIDIKGVAFDTPLENLVEIVRETGHSRMPVYRDDLDNIVGLLYTKDLLGYNYEFRKPQSLGQLMRDVYYVPETKFCGELLREFQEKGFYMGIVVDEYGGTEGLVTVEDILEEIVGEIQDEHDTEEPLMIDLGSGAYLVDGLMNIEDLGESLGLDLGGEGYDTLGGFIYDKLGRVPHPGESFESNQLRFIVTKLLKRRVSKVRISRLPDMPENENDSGQQK